MKKRIDYLLSKAKFQLSENELKRIEKDLKKFQEQLKILDEFNFSNIEPLSHPFEKNFSYLREDIPEEFSNDEILKNASKMNKKYIFFQTKKGKKNV